MMFSPLLQRCVIVPSLNLTGFCSPWQRCMVLTSCRTPTVTHGCTVTHGFKNLRLRFLRPKYNCGTCVMIVMYKMLCTEVLCCLSFYMAAPQNYLKQWNSSDNPAAVDNSACRYLPPYCAGVVQYLPHYNIIFIYFFIYSISSRC